MGVCLARDKKDHTRFTLNAWSDRPKGVFEEIGEQFGTLVPHLKNVVETEEHTIVDLSFIELLTSYLDYLRESLQDGLIPIIIEASIIKQKGFYELYTLMHLSPKPKDLEINFCLENAKWFGEDKTPQAEISFELWAERI